MSNIYVLEGADGTGKSTLAEYIAKELNGMVFHAVYDKDIDMREYHEYLLIAARKLVKLGIPVILDRWALSELIYGKVFRDGPSYDAEWLLHQDDLIYIYCRNDNVVSNHLSNMKDRKELYDDMAQIAVEYDKYIEKSDLVWSVYDFNYDEMKDFLKGVLENVANN